MKSIGGLLYGIGFDDGLVPGLETPLRDLFSECSELRDGSAREEITVADALSVQMGTAWDERLPYTDPRNSEIAMELADDRHRFVLDRPMVTEPGRVWTYNGIAVALLARVISQGAGMENGEFARSRLFEPLGTTNFEWARGADGVPSAASGLRSKASDLATIGVILAQGGVDDGRRILSEAWLEASFRSRDSIMKDFDYGMLWYLAGGPSGDQIVIVSGNGGQRRTVQPSASFVAVTFAGNHNAPDARQLPIRVLVDYAVPEVNRMLSE